MSKSAHPDPLDIGGLSLPVFDPVIWAHQPAEGPVKQMKFKVAKQRTNAVARKDRNIRLEFPTEDKP